ncbi:MAG: multidrug efflux RND transporter permease subunit [Gammaproteobacteria bacterium]|nr:multidrug efflux RND transporter permease subunit [Gammaproteobacteria bacterium]MBT5826671.1 multidrug efflux RND transporter permease subunit [Gammaproteobacteria bacterium]MBT6577032.1 multidrug efflux RND transporter permease subunit [Gammaproteobacteria bacterium]
MFSRFFIERPIFASVISIVLLIAGIVSVLSLPSAQYPEITPPTVEVKASYPGANAQVVAETVAAPIEQQVNGVENSLYMSSTSAGDGSYTLTVTFEVGTDLDMAQVMVQNRVALATPNLPEEVNRQGVNTKKKSANIILFVSLISPDETFDELYLSNYATLNIRDQISRIKGVGDVLIFPPSDYSMRIWLNPEQLKSRGITTQDVLNEMREQNVQVAAGQIGQPPVPEGINFQYTINVLGRLTEIAQFEDMIIKTGETGNITRLKDVARLELGGKTYDISSNMTGSPSASISIYQLPGANALDVADQVRAKMEELAANFPQGLEYKIPYDTTLFVSASIDEVFVTLYQAGALVFIVLFIFLQDWRATLIPAVTIPVSLIATFIVMAMMGFSLNMLTLFGLVLAIGIVVDDSIVVVEATAAYIDKGMSSRAAAIQAMQDVSGPVVATTMVLLAVFVPTAFLPGITGEMYRQFSLTIAVSTVFSSLNALTLSPALAGLLLRPTKKDKNAFFRGFDRFFEKASNGYANFLKRVVRRGFLMMLIALAIAVASGWQFGKIPSAFLPVEDQGYVITSVQLPDAASKQRTDEVLQQINVILEATPGLQDWVSLGGFSMIDGTNASNAATIFVVMKPWDERTAENETQEAILKHLNQKFRAIQEAIVFTFVPPAIPGLGVSGGFQMQIQDKGNVGLDELQRMANEMIADSRSQSGLAGLNSTFRAGVPQLFAEVDRTKAKTLDIPLNDVFSTLQAYLGSAYVNDFNKFGRTWQVKVQADSEFRSKPEDIRQLEVRNRKGEMIPLGTLIRVDETLGPQTILRYNLYPAASITGSAAEGFSSGEALNLMEQMAKSKFPAAMGFEWTGMSYQEKKVGNEAFVIFALAIVLVFLVLAAQYESWSLPLAVLLVVPLALLGTVAALMMREFDNNIYTQIGIVLIIGLASKNAILIVELASEQRAKGVAIFDSAVEASRLRFRAILMTAFSSVLGFLPLVVASGAGAASRQAIGTTVVGGMIAAVCMSLIFTPVFYAVMQSLSERFSKAEAG